MERTIHQKLIAVFILLLAGISRLQGQIQSCGSPLEPDFVFNSPSGVIENSAWIDLDDYVSVTETSHPVDYGVCASSTVSTMSSWSITIGSASADLEAFTVNNSEGRIYFPTTPSTEQITLVISSTITKTFTVKNNRVCTVYDPGTGTSEVRCITSNTNVTLDAIAKSQTNNSVAITLKESKTLTPGSDYTFPSTVCDGDGITVEITSPRSGSTYRLRPSSNTSSIVASETGGDVVLDATQLGQLWNADDEEYRFIVTEKRDYEYETIDNSDSYQAWITEEDPSISQITGESHICPGSYSQTYSVQAGNDGYDWKCTNCSLDSDDGSRTMTVTWDKSKSSGKIEVRAYETSENGTSCYTGWEDVDVDIKSYSTWTVGGDDQVCNGATGSVTLSGSTGAKTYRLYKGDTNHDQDKTGTGGALAWSGLATGSSWTVKLVHSSECGEYSMGTHTIGERAKSAAPTSISGTAQICAGSGVALTAATANTNTGWDWQFYTGSWSSSISDQDNNTLSHSAVPGTTKYRARYLDQNSCESSWKEYTVHIESIPAAPTISGLFTNICVDDEEQTYAISGTADSFEWEATGGVPSSGTGDATITWDKTKSSWSIKARSINTQGAALCPGPWTTQVVTLRKDVDFYTVGGDDFVCDGETGEITLDDSQTEFTYYLFISDTQVPASANAGSGEALSWTGVAPGTYQVRVHHGATCGYYSMGTHTISERAKSTAPTSITGTAQICAGSQVTLTAATGNTNTDWDWQSSDGSSWSSSISGQDDNTLSHSAVPGTTKYRARYLDQNSCESSWKEYTVHIESIPAAPTISGLFADICVDDEEQTYAISGTADSYEWEATGGVPASGTGNATITWDKTESSWSVRARGINTEGDATCPGPWTTQVVTLRKDVDFYTVGGDDFVCDGETGEITLDDSQTEFTYYLFISDTQVPASANAGSGEALSWTGVAPGTYQVRVHHGATCGYYSMGSHTIGERAKSAAPTSISGTAQVCAGSQVALTAATGNASTDWDWQFYTGSWSSSISGQDDNTLSHSAVLGTTKYRARYLDQNSCESSWKEYAVHIESIPAAPTISGLFTDICVGDEEQTYAISGTADSYEWEATGGVPVSGTGDATITWDKTKSDWSIRARGINTQGATLCPGPWTTENVILRKDVNFYTVGGDDFVCNGETGEIRLDDSQADYNYFLFDADVQVAGSSNAGYGGALSWSGILPGIEYEIRAYHPQCGWYSMGFHTITERTIPAAPNITGITDICIDSDITLVASTSNASTSWVWSKKEQDTWAVIPGEESADLVHTINGDVTAFKAVYIDQDGCLSAEKVIAINPVLSPAEPTISGETDICVSDHIQQYTVSGDADDFEWAVVGGSLDRLAGRAVTVSWDESKSSGWKVQARGINRGGAALCRGAYQTYEVRVSPPGELTIDEVEFCPESREVNLFDQVDDTHGSWSGSGLFNHSFVNPESLGEGDHYFTYTTLPDGGCQESGEMKFTVYQKPQEPMLAEIYNVCPGEQRTIEVGNAIDGLSYDWYYASNDEWFAQGRRADIDTDLDFDFYVVATNQVRCSAAAASGVRAHGISGTISSSPGVQIQSGEAVKFQTTAVGNSYYWEFTGDYRSDLASPIMVFHLADTIDVSLTVVNQFGCERVFEYEDFLIVDDVKGVYGNSVEDVRSSLRERVVIEENGTTMKFYPNPTPGTILNIEFTSIFAETISIKIYDLNLNLLGFQQFHVAEGQNNLQIDVSRVKPGLYLVWIVGRQWNVPMLFVGSKQ